MASLIIITFQVSTSGTLKDGQLCLLTDYTITIGQGNVTRDRTTRWCTVKSSCTHEQFL